MSYAGQGVNEKAFERFDQIERKKFEKKLPEAYAKIVYSSLSDTEIMSPERAIKYVKENSPLDNDEVIVKGINNLLDNNQLIGTTHKGKLWIRKNSLKGII